MHTPLLRCWGFQLWLYVSHSFLVESEPLCCSKPWVEVFPISTRDRLSDHVAFVDKSLQLY